MPALSLLFFVIERGVLMVLIFDKKGMLEKVAIQRTVNPGILGVFFIYRVRVVKTIYSELRKPSLSKFYYNILLFPVDRDTNESFCRLESNVFDTASLFLKNQSRGTLKCTTWRHFLYLYLIIYFPLPLTKMNTKYLTK